MNQKNQKNKTKWIVLPCLLLASLSLLSAQTSSPQATSTQAALPQSSPTETDLPPTSVPQASLPVPFATAAPVPAGTALMVRLDTTLATFSNRVGDPFQGKVTQAVVVNGSTLIPVGATVEGRVTKVTEPRRIAGKPTLGILAEAVILPTGERHFLDATLVDTDIKGTDVNQEGQFKGFGHDRRDQLEVGGGAAGGMLIGGLIGGGPGILIGGAVGATSTTAHWLAKHRSAILPAGTELTLELNRPMAMGTVVANSGSK
ncbi:MAG: hypothetical protein ABSG72_12860 [Candidatus Sulfotelmatobacter sp.]|jgi:hypothetical protein